MVKKAFMKTIEVLLVIVISSIFIISITEDKSQLTRTSHDSYLINLERDSSFRDFVTNNNACFNSTPQNNLTLLIQRYIPIEYDYVICTGPTVGALPEKDIYVDTLVHAGNYSETNFKTVKLYYWTE